MFVSEVAADADHLGLFLSAKRRNQHRMLSVSLWACRSARVALSGSYWLFMWEEGTVSVGELVAAAA